MPASLYDPNGFAYSLQQQILNLAASIPKPASAMPRGVADLSSVGTDATVYAIADHTHASKARKQRVTGVTAATYTWTYPTPFASGVVPICNAIVEDPVNSLTDSYNVQIEGVPTNSQCVFRVKRMSSGLLALATGALSINSTPGNINLHMTALEP